MRAINIEVDISKLKEIESFIQTINSNDELAACRAGEGKICVAAIGDCGIAYAEALAVHAFDNYAIITKIK